MNFKILVVMKRNSISTLNSQFSTFNSLILLLALLLVPALTPAQDLPRYKRIVKQLASRKYQGRGYAHEGVRKAAKYIEREFRRSGVDEVTLQPFCLDINTFPGRMELAVDGRKLKAGRDFTVREYNPALYGDFNLYHIDTLHYDFQRIRADLARPENRGAFVVCDFWFPYRHRSDFAFIQNRDSSGVGGLIYTWREPLKFYKAYGERVADVPTLWTLASVMPDDARSIRACIDQQFFKDYATDNVIAKVEGQRHDSCYIFTAHYDHLGNLGRKVFYGGANDNASGTAAIITLARHYAEHRPRFDTYFIAFSGEDAYLRGSRWYVDHPVVPLERIKYLFNIDMIGDNNPVLHCEPSDAGAWAMPVLEQLNSRGQYFQALKRAPLEEKSDHYPFAVRGVPCIFFENEEGDAFPFYHTPQDDWQHVRHDTYEPLFRLITEFL